MSKRLPSDAEKRLWQESNKFTNKKQPDELLPEDEDELHETEPAVVKLTAAKTVTKKPSTAPLAPLAPREAKRYRNTHPYIQATLDLHGLTKLESCELVQHFIGRNYRIGRRHVAIITGKGSRGTEGVLRAELPHWLNEGGLRPMIASMFHAAERDGGKGVMHVILKNSSKHSEC